MIYVFEKITSFQHELKMMTLSTGENISSSNYPGHMVHVTGEAMTDFSEQQHI